MLVARGTELWTADHELRMPLGIRFPTRMTVVRLPDRTLALVSAIPIGDALAAELAELGDVSHLIAPNNLHHLHLGAAKKRYPAARILAAPGVAAKEPDLRTEPLAVESTPALRDVLMARPIEGAPKIGETVLHHAPSRSLLVTDLVFNVEQPGTFATALLLASTGTRGRLAQSRVWSWLVADAALARASTARIFDLEFERVIVAHGNIVETEARAQLAGALTRTGSPLLRQTAAVDAAPPPGTTTR